MMESLTNTAKRMLGSVEREFKTPVGKRLKMGEENLHVEPPVELPPVVERHVELPPVVERQVELPPVERQVELPAPAVQPLVFVAEEKKVAAPAEEDYFDSMPGFVPLANMKEPTGKAPPSTESMAQKEWNLVSRLPHHKFDSDNIDIRQADRKTIDAREATEQERHINAMFALKQERRILDETKETDKNLLLVRKGGELINGLMDKASVKARNRAKRAANRQALDAARPHQPALRLEYREPQKPRWSRALLKSLEPQKRRGVGARRIPEAVEVSPEEAQAEDDAIPAEDVSGEDIAESDEGDYSEEGRA